MAYMIELTEQQVEIFEEAMKRVDKTAVFLNSLSQEKICQG